MKQQTFSISTKILVTGLIFSMGMMWIPQSAQALSCINPNDMTEQYASGEEYTVALVKPTSLETEGEMHDQEIEVIEVYKGELDDNEVVSFVYDQTWQYLCAGSPAEVGEEVVYVISEGTVVQASLPDSEFVNTLLPLIDEDAPEAVTPGTVPDVSPPTPSEPTPTIDGDELEKRTLMKRVISLLQQLLSLLSA